MAHSETDKRLTSAQARLAAFGARTAMAVIALGLLVIGLGYNGIAGASVNGHVDLRAQLPYLISGGVFGLALVVLGAAMLVTQSAREDRGALAAALEELIALQREVLAASAPRGAEVLFAAGTDSFHLPSCRLVAGREATRYVTEDEARTRELKACRVCRPETTAVSARA